MISSAFHSSRFAGGLLLSSMCLALSAQSTGVTTSDLRGTVRTATGAAIPGATLRLIQESTGVARTFKSDANGGYVFRLLYPGSYTLVVEAKGMQTSKQAGLALRVGQTLEVPIELKAEEAQAEVVVTATSSLADPARTQVSTTIDNNLITNLPISRRDFTAFSLTTPHVATDNTPGGTIGATASSGLSFSGQSARQNNIMVDGLDNNDIAVGAVRTTFSQEAVQEFAVVANGFSAEYGRAAGGTLNIVTKSGGNDFAGSLFAFFRNDSMEAKRPLSGQSTPFDQQQFGATASGPILKDKLFYFVAVERFNRKDTNNVTIDPVTSLALMDQMGVKVASGNQPFHENYTTAIVKLDAVTSPNSRWSLRYTHAEETNENQLPWSGQTDRSNGGVREVTDNSFSLGHTWTGSSLFSNEFRVLYSSRDHNLRSLDTANTPQVTIAGFAQIGTQPFLPQLRTEHDLEVVDTLSFFVGNHTIKAGVDAMHTSGHAYIPLDTNGIYVFQALGVIAPNFAIADGQQAFTGIGTVLDNNGNPVGTAPFMNPFTGQPGLPAAFVQAFGDGHITTNTRYDSLFLQDDWQLTPTFSLKVGVRYDRETLPPFPDTPDYQALQAGGPYQLDTFSIFALPGATDATVVPGGPYRSADLFRVSRDWSSSRVSPRLAFNWQATPSARIYGGYGHFSGRTQLGPYSGVALQNGVRLRTIVQVAGVDNVATGDPANPYLPAPWYSWAQPNHRYASIADVPASANAATILLPGASEMPLTKQANLGLEWMARKDLKLTFDAIHVEGSHFLNVRDVNSAVPNPAFLTDQTQPPIRRVDARYSSIYLHDGSGESRYTSFAFGTAWQVEDRLALNVNYTWSHAEDNYIDWLTDYALMNPFDAKANMSTSNQDQRHRFLFSAVYHTKGASAWSRDWIISLIGRFTSGRPYSRLTGVDNDYGAYGGIPLGNGDGGDAPADRPLGAPRNGERLPFYQNVDLRVSRSFPLGGRTRLELMADVFNVFNHYNVSMVQNIVSLPTYGQPIVQSNVDLNRQAQLGVRLSF